MPTVSQRSFTGGEISPSLYSRVDFAKYQTSLAKCKNFIPLKYGGVENRSGTEFAAEAGISDSEVRLIPFDAGSAGTMMLELGNEYIRFFKNGASVMDFTTLAVTNITGTNPITVTHASGSIPSGEVVITGIVGTYGNIINGRRFRIANVTATTFELREMDNSVFTGSGTYTSGGTIEHPYQITSPFSTNLFKIKYAQSLDIMVFASRDYDLAYLKRNADYDWTWETSVGNSVGFVNVASITNGGTPGSTTYRYAIAQVYGGIIGPVVCSNSPATPRGLIETTTGNATLNAANYNQIAITATGFYDYFNIYKQNDAGVYGLIGQTTSTTFRDIGFTPDAANTFPDERYNIQTAGAVGFVQQRLFLGDITSLSIPRKNGIQLTIAERETVAGSAIGQFNAFTKNGTITDASSLSFVAASKKFNPPRHILDMSKMVVMTEGAEFVINADGSPITASNLSVKAQSYNGCSEVPPIIINESCLYIQNRGNIVRDLAFDFNIDGFSGNEISIFSHHLFDGHEVIDWCYQQYPNSNVWAVRSDGKLLCLTYLKEQQVLAWSQHELQDASVLSVACVPEGDEDAVYMLVERVIDGRTVKYVERLSNRFIDQTLTKTYDTEDEVGLERSYSGLSEMVFMDSATHYDGRNTDVSKKVKVTTGGTVDDLLTVQANSSIFKASDVGNSVYIYFEGDLVRFLISEYTSATEVECYPSKNIPTGMVDFYTSDYSLATIAVSNLWHLEGKEVSVFGDGFVDGNPNNPAYDVLTVTNGSITLPNAREYVTVGIPYMSDLKTLRIDTVQSETLNNKKILINKLTMNLKDTRGLWAGNSEPTGTVDGLYEMKVRDIEPYADPINLRTGVNSVNIDPEYSSGGQVFIRQVDPIPATILSIHPEGIIPFSGG